MTTKILTGDCRTILKTLPDDSIDCVVTSPPYFGLRDYGIDRQIGLEASPAAYVAEMVQIFREVRRVLAKDGTLWLVIGDSYNGSGKGGDYGNSPKQRSNAGANIDRPMRLASLKSKDLIGIPWRVAFALQDDGWYLRQDIIWHKLNPMPESVRDRCTKAHEYIFLLSKSPRYFYDAEAISEPTGTIGKTWADRKAMGFKGDTKHPTSDAIQMGLSIPTFAPSPTGRNKRSVWSLVSRPFPGAHFATFPPKLVELCLKAGCPHGGVVLDPFGGAGTTSLVADRMGLDSIMIELNPDYAEIAKWRLIEEAGMFAQVAAQ